VRSLARFSTLSLRAASLYVQRSARRGPWPLTEGERRPLGDKARKDKGKSPRQLALECALAALSQLADLAAAAATKAESSAALVRAVSEGLFDGVWPRLRAGAACRRALAAQRRTSRSCARSARPSRTHRPSRSGADSAARRGCLERHGVTCVRRVVPHQASVAELAAA
jgi:hypothetical protein